MPKPCDICGTLSLNAHELVEEWLPFRGRRNYCPVCYRRFLHRLYTGLALLPLSIGLLGIWQAMTADQPLLQNTGVWIAALLFTQWACIIPHELGHALVAKWLGYQNVRILIGSGKPLLTFRFRNIHWLVNRLPFGGFTLVLPPAAPSRWKDVLLVAGGPLVNCLLAMAAWSFLDSGGLLPWSRTIPGVLLWANLIVLVENLIPRAVQTPYGLAYTDGLQLWRMLSYRSERQPVEDDSIPPWVIRLCYLLKWSVVVVVGGVSLLFVWLVGRILLSEDAGLSARSESVLCGLCVVLAAASAWASWRIARQPIATTRRRLPMSVDERGGQELLQGSRWSLNPAEFLTLQERLETQELGAALTQIEQALLRYPGDVFLLAYRAHIAVSQGELDQCERLYDEAMSADPTLGRSACAVLLVAKLSCLIEQQEIGRADELCRSYLAVEPALELKVHILDTLACACLCRDKGIFLECAEGWVREALNLAPGTVTLKGTLGGLLAEQGRDSEAGLLLRDCMEGSPQLHDQGISAFFLGLLALRGGQPKKGKELLVRATILHPAPWLIQRANSVLQA